MLESAWVKEWLRGVNELQRQRGHLLEWDADGDELQKTIFATWTLARRPRS